MEGGDFGLKTVPGLSPRGMQKSCGSRGLKFFSGRNTDPS
jgi:hypothetical protein